MSRFLKIMLLLVTLGAVGPAFAQQDLTGPWQGKLAVDAKTSLTIQFTFSKKPDGTYAAVVDSTDGNIKSVPATAVTYNAGALKVDVAALSGSFSGTLKDGKLDGRWTQPGQTLPLVLSAYQKPVLSKTAMDALTGTWHGPVSVPGVSLTFVAKFKRNDKGELTGSLSVPEQGGNELPISDIQFADNKLDFKVEAVKGEMVADYVNGGLNGLWRQGGNPPAGVVVNLKKGEFAAPVYPLKLSAESFASIAGKWSGKVTSPQGSATVVLRFEVDKGGQYVGFLDVPDRGVKGLPIGEATLAGAKFTVKTTGAPLEFDGTLSGKTMVGQWIAPTPQGPVPTPLTLTRE
jgi:hypothetical protein